MSEFLNRRAFAKFLGALTGSLALPRTAAAGLAAPLAPQNQSVTDAILINSNENPYGPSQRARDAMWQSQHVAGRYPDDVDGKVTEAIARLHNVGAEQVVLGCGSTEILRMADMAFTGPDRNVVACQPTFEAVLGFTRVTKAEGVQVPQTADFRHDLAAMAAACNEKTGMIYVCNPNNPTGTIVSREELAAFIPRVPAHVKIMIDEAYFHFVEDAGYASAQSFIRNHPNVFIVRTFSKIYGMAGLRLGYSISAPDVAEAMRRHSFFSNVNATVGEAAVASLEDANHVPRMRQVNNDLRRWLCAEFEKDGRRYIPAHTNFVMVHTGSDASPLIEAFAKRGIFIGRKFAKMENWLRITIGTRPEMEAFLAAFREIVPVSRAQAA